MYKIIAKAKDLKDRPFDKIIKNDFTSFEEVEDFTVNFYNYYDEDEYDVSEIVVESGYYTWIFTRTEDMKFELTGKKIV